MEKSLPKGWIISNIEQSVTILDNIRKPVSATERAKRSGNIPYYGATGLAGHIDDYLFDEELVLIGEDGAPFFDKQKNVAFIISGKSWVNNHAHVLKAKTNTLNKFILHYLNQFDYNGFVGGTTRLKLTQGDLKKIPFPLPPLSEQERIVAKLDQLFAQHDKIKKALDRIPQLLKTFRQQVLTHAVTGKLTEQWREGKELDEWKDEKLNNITASISDGDHQAPPKSDIGIPFLVISDVSSGKLDVKKSKRFVPDHYYDNLKENRKPKLNDILYTVTGSFGIPIIVDTEEPFCFQRHIGIVRPDRVKVHHKFLFYFLKSNLAYSQSMESATGTAQLTVSLGSLRNFDIPLPPIQEQQEIVRRVESLFFKADAIETRYQTVKAKIDNLPQAILHKAFKGELVSQLPTDGDAKDLLADIMVLKSDMDRKRGKI